MWVGLKPLGYIPLWWEARGETCILNISAEVLSWILICWLWILANSRSLSFFPQVLKNFKSIWSWICLAMTIVLGWSTIVIRVVQKVSVFVILRTKYLHKVQSIHSMEPISTGVRYVSTGRTNRATLFRVSFRKLSLQNLYSTYICWKRVKSAVQLVIVVHSDLLLSIFWPSSSHLVLFTCFCWFYRISWSSIESLRSTLHFLQI